ncbi:hypothetical protein [Bacillus sp. FJAT-49736]|uniref:hypothetical protein n=1 Tax=Bacillus sp. FJAT-49736 TaxID=2833582 RepID=UPI001BC8EDD3|nr:hypothetical protein [Bacillus sp. FJAT-49736]MBS4174236.1 hypothetical protein [Bacillus sp. FJAT-49736]
MENYHVMKSKVELIDVYHYKFMIIVFDFIVFLFKTNNKGNSWDWRDYSKVRRNYCLIWRDYDPKWRDYAGVWRNNIGNGRIIPLVWRE